MAERALRRHDAAGTILLASHEGREEYTGINSHFMFVRPDAAVARLLIDKAGSGDFRIFTNGEQDVIETIYSPRVVQRNRSTEFIRHIHPNKHRSARTGGRMWGTGMIRTVPRGGITGGAWLMSILRRGDGLRRMCASSIAHPNTDPRKYIAPDIATARARH